MNEHIEGTIAFVDVADQGKDFTALAIAAIIGKQLYIVDYLFNRDNTDITIPLIAQKLNKWNVRYCRVESNSMGAMFSRYLQKETFTKILQVHNTANKITRIIMQSSFLINNCIFVIDETQDSIQFIDNVESFSKEGKNKHDDAPDCLSGLALFAQSLFKHLFA